jgi:DNA-binding MarR family transcriptional regulator
MPAKARKAAAAGVGAIDTSYLESLIGYNARRASLAVIEVFMQRMKVYDLRPVDFSVLSLVTHNPGITSRQLCATLGIQPPNLVGMVYTLEKRGLITREAHPTDARAVGLHLTRAGKELAREAERTVAKLEAEAGSRLTPAEARTLMRLLRKIYR